MSVWTSCVCNLIVHWMFFSFLSKVPCAPQNVSAALLCLNHSAPVTWVGSPSAIGYNVTATAQDGHTHHCHTNSTSCQVQGIHCGETYSITVTPYSQTCTGNPSAAYSFQAGTWSHILSMRRALPTFQKDNRKPFVLCSLQAVALLVTSPCLQLVRATAQSPGLL